jgi:hypothetical protein
MLSAVPKPELNCLTRPTSTLSHAAKRLLPFSGAFAVNIADNAPLNRLSTSV